MYDSPTKSKEPARDAVGGDARSADRYLISLAKFPIRVATADGQSADGHLCDVSARGCLLSTPADALQVRPRDELVVTAGEHCMSGRVVHTSQFGARVSIGIEVAEVPPDLVESVRRVGGAIRYDRRTISIVGILAMPVAVQAMHLVREPQTTTVDLRLCEGIELAGAGFLLLARERGKTIINVNERIAPLIELAGIEVG